MSELPIDLDQPLAGQLARVLDVEGKIPRALDALGELAGQDVLAVDAGELRAAQLEALGARVRPYGAPLVDPAGGPPLA